MSEKSVAKSTRNICFTLNNYSEEEIEHIRNIECKYGVFGYEVGESGTPHLQGYIEFKSSKLFTTIKRLLPRAHIETRRGSPQQATDYCKKEGDWIEFGDNKACVQPGKRTNLDNIVDMLREGASLKEISEEYPKSMIRMGNGIKNVKNLYTKHRTVAPEVYWFWGETGSDTLQKAMEIGKTYYIKDNTKWWDGYDHEEVIIFDNFNGKFPFWDLLHLLDWTPYQGQIRRSYVKINSPFVVIICQFPPEHFWKDNKLAQVHRRLNEICEIRVDSKN